jgi:glutathione S-transferase
MADAARAAAGIAKLGLKATLSSDPGAKAIVTYLQAVRGASSGADDDVQPLASTPEQTAGVDVLLFAWELSYFSGKVRGYLRYKQRAAGLRYEEVLATPEIIAEVLAPATKSNTVPQCQLPSGEVVHDSTEIIERVEALFPTAPVIPSTADRPRQRVACELLELFGDEWLLVAAYHWRWAYSGDGSAAQRLPAGAGSTPAAAEQRSASYLQPDQRAYNAQQWGDVFLPDEPPADRRAVGGNLFDAMMYTMGSKRGLPALGVPTDELATAWEDATLQFLGLFEQHLMAGHDFGLGGRPSIADFGVLGPLYAHLYRDPVPSLLLRTRYPLVAAWCERVHDRGGAPHFSRKYHYDPAARRLVAPTAEASDNGEWFEDDAIPATLSVTNPHLILI